METPSPETLDLINPLRDASRKLIREWGFLRATLAGANLSPAAVHALIEMGDYGRRDFSDLCCELKVTRDQLITILSELLSAGHIKLDEANPTKEIYSLTPSGLTTLTAITAYAQNQVLSALAEAPPGAGPNITSAFRIYATALERARVSSTCVPTPATTLPPPPPSSTIKIVPGYRHGILARTLEMHIDYYGPLYNWGAPFEAGLASSLTKLISRLDQPMNQAWSAVDTTNNKIVGTVFIDGESCGIEGVAKLRALIVDPSTRGQGAGRKLFDSAMDFVHTKGFKECRLNTSRALEVARGMYEAAGFELVNEFWPEGFTKGVKEMEYVWRRPESCS
ncbi:acyl-CoA N-acyltransferase [Podospora fimiseda]|uniref:Acyl-CoA N-acyltransferase n=1 Tax=Podospora fimiseda TaxID=252190 RepID=A0AAN7BUX9_9PEZI|nr:acyl-CoA N-acyltransferase [Podospora fimiseda]